ncbi:VOC family protein [Deminuibacter soli]|uniref:VOC family protein n=1 Tax=Deminuibacter soli TaxID=2291815 RepID=A0A3E1NKM2_9BACT|nr:VOC family protein [Deminuibacter soli]RFM28447.1 VOC family protein [Deminuibacter soli]
MKITLTSIPVNDQEKALRFYTSVLGFVKKNDFPAGNARWLTVVAPEATDGIELLLEPMAFAPALVYQQSLYEAGIPYTSFSVTDLQAEYERMEQLGVRFTMQPTTMGPVHLAVFDDTCGNLIQLAQHTH